MTKYKTEKRHAKIGERIKITNAGRTFGEYEQGDVFTVRKYFEGREGWVHAGGVEVAIAPEEYEVIGKTEKRHAKVGERVLITNAEDTFGNYENGDILSVTYAHGDGDIDFSDDAVFVGLEEYEVIIEEESELTKTDECKKECGTVKVESNGVKMEGTAEEISKLLKELQSGLDNDKEDGEEEETLSVGDYVIPNEGTFGKYAITKKGEMILGRVEKTGLFDGEIKVIILEHKSNRLNGEEYRVNPTYFDKITAEEAQLIKADKPSKKHGVGEYVKVINARKGALLGFEDGDYAEVINNSRKQGNDHAIRNVKTGFIGYTQESNLEKIGELSERELSFVRAGREIDEVKDGDIVEVMKKGHTGSELMPGTIAEVYSNDGIGAELSSKNNVKHHGACHHILRNLKLIAKAEDRVDIDG